MTMLSDSVVAVPVLLQDRGTTSPCLSAFAPSGLRLAAAITALGSDLIGVPIGAETGAIVINDMWAWMPERLATGAVAQFESRPQLGSCFVSIPSDLIFHMVDFFFGGTGNGSAKTLLMTGSDERVAMLFCGTIATCLGDAWRDAPMSKFGFLGLIRDANMPADAEKFVIQTITVRYGLDQKAEIDFAYPQRMFSASTNPNNTASRTDSGDLDRSWQGELATTALHVKFPVRAILARPEITAESFLTLEPGVIIPITIPPKIPVLIGNRVFALGALGEAGGYSSIQIETITKGALPNV